MLHQKKKNVQKYKRKKKHKEEAENYVKKDIQNVQELQISSESWAVSGSRPVHPPPRTGASNIKTRRQ